MTFKTRKKTCDFLSCHASTKQTKFIVAFDSGEGQTENEREPFQENESYMAITILKTWYQWMRFDAQA